jgi:hypothetical protein
MTTRRTNAGCRGEPVSQRPERPAMRTDGAARPVATLPCWVMRLGYTATFALPGFA